MISINELLPEDREQALLVGRVFDPLVGGPCIVCVDGDDLVDMTFIEPTMSRLLARPDLVDVVRAARTGDRRWSIDEVLPAMSGSSAGALRLLAPIDLQVVKAAGVTFVGSMLERVVEERAKGNPEDANRIRGQLVEIIGGSIASVKPGSPEAAEVKAMLIRDGLWSQYLEVGIGPDPEVFTKAPVLSAVGCGENIGVLKRSVWNNPEPELVVAVRADGTAVGATLGNDVNLRDIEGRSALLLGEAKDNNASCAIGPFIRLFDESFGMNEIRSMDITLRVEGLDGFVMDGSSSLSNISRDPEELVAHVIGKNHQYPDGFVLFTGTLFAPTQDRHQPGGGFTHDLGDVVRISTPLLGQLANTVTHCETAEPWTFGIWSLISNLHARDLLPAN